MVGFHGQPDQTLTLVSSIWPLGFDLTSCDPCGTISGWDMVIVLLICTNGELHHHKNAHVVSHRQ